MAELAGFPSAEVVFDRDGHVEGAVDGARALAADPAVTDLVVLAHGWNNDAAQARTLFGKLAASMRQGGPADGIGILGVIWPSKQFQDAAPAGGPAAGVGSGVGTDDLRTQIDDLRPVFSRPAELAKLDEAAALLPVLEDSRSARRTFAETVRSLLTPAAADSEDGPAALFAKPGDTVMDRLAVPARLAAPGSGAGGAAHVGDGGPVGGTGGAAGLGGTLAGVLGAARNLLNYTTFYEMKDRSGVVGLTGLAPLLATIRDDRPDLRLHLVGHSFGARLVTAASSVAPAGGLRTLTLLQAAYSHFGLSADWDTGKDGAQPGTFATVLGNGTVTGPIAVTHTARDTAVGIAYAIASRLAGQVAQAVGDADDVYGGMGRNGAQRTEPVVAGELLDVSGTYSWTPGAVHNLLADKFVTGHSDVTGPQIGHALLSVIAAGA